jgi:HK97 family phage portal protein
VLTHAFRATAAILTAPPVAKDSITRPMVLDSGTGLGALGIDPPVDPADYLSLYNTLVTVYRCAGLNAQSVSQGDLILSRFRPDGERVELPDTAPIVQFFEQPNPSMSGRDLIESTVLDLELTGNAYWELVRAGNPLTGPVVEAWRLNPGRVRIIPGKDEIKGYWFEVNAGRQFLEVERVQRFEWMDPVNDFYGQSPARPATKGIVNDQRLEVFANSVLENGAMPSGVLMLDAHVDEGLVRAAQESWNNTYAGQKNAGKTVMLVGGQKYQAITMSLSDLQAFETRKWNREQVLHAYGVYPIVYGIMDTSATRENATVQERLYHELTVKPKGSRLGRQLTDVALPRFGYPMTDDVSVTFDFSDTSIERRLRRDEATANAALIGMGVYSPNDIRQQLGEDPREGGDVYVNPTATGATVAMSAFPGVTKAVTKDKTVDDAIQEAVLKPTDVLVQAFRELLEGVLLEQGAEALSELGLEVGFEGGSFIERWLTEKMITFTDVVLNEHLEEVREALIEGVRDGESITQLAERLDEWTGGRKRKAMVVARTEVIGAANEGRTAAYQEAGITEHVWITSRDDAVRDSHARL